MIDAHQHFWRIGRNDCHWPTPDLAAIHRDRTTGDLIELAAPLGVHGSVLIQSQPNDRDTDYLLHLAAVAPFVRAVVGWADLAAPDAARRIAHLAARPKFRGLRPMLQDLAQDDWILQPALAPAVAAMFAHGLSFDALVAPRHLRSLRVFAERHPRLAIVIDHAGKPDIASDALDPWRDDIAALAALPQVFCKLSGLPTLLAPGQPAQAVRPYIDHLLEIFAPERLMWGSDWPVVDLGGGYTAWLRLAREALQSLPETDVAKVFGVTAQQFYRF